MKPFSGLQAKGRDFEVKRDILRKYKVLPPISK